MYCVCVLPQAWRYIPCHAGQPTAGHGWQGKNGQWGVYDTYLLGLGESQAVHSIDIDLCSGKGLWWSYNFVNHPLTLQYMSLMAELGEGPPPKPEPAQTHRPFTQPPPHMGGMTNIRQVCCHTFLSSSNHSAWASFSNPDSLPLCCHYSNIPHGSSPMPTSPQVWWAQPCSHQPACPHHRWWDHLHPYHLAVGHCHHGSSLL